MKQVKTEIILSYLEGQSTAEPNTDPGSTAGYPHNGINSKIYSNSPVKMSNYTDVP
jgi:hypothetical protein